MTIDFHDAVNGDGLFDVLGKAFFAQSTLNTARGTTVPTEVEDLLDQFRLLAGDTVRDQIIAPVPAATTGFQASGNSLASSLQQFCRQFLIDTVNRDVTLPRPELSLALAELIRQMVANSESVDASTVSAAVTPGGSNLGNGVVLTSIRRGDGLVQENLIGETISVRAASADSLVCEAAPAPDALSFNWPEGSGASVGIPVASTTSSLLTGGGMDSDSVLADSPDGWLVPVGTIGTTVKLTTIEVQTVAISGSPTGGDYSLQYTNAAGIVQVTNPIAWNATADAVQSALRALTGLSAITVTATGTSPNLTHTVTFTGVGGNVAQLTSIDRLTGGTPVITHNTTVGGTPQVFSGARALELDSDGAQLTTLMQRVTTLQPLTAYAVSLWAIADVVPAAGAITIDLVNGVGGAVIQDAQGVNNSLSFDADDLTTGWQHLSALVSGECVFRMPAVVPDIAYFRIRISTAVSAGTSVFIDNVALTRMQALYPGGPLAAAFAGSSPFAVTDTFEIVTTNDRAGLVQEWFNRNFNMAQLGLLLPSDSTSNETIPDSVVS